MSEDRTPITRTEGITTVHDSIAEQNSVAEVRQNVKNPGLNQHNSRFLGRRKSRKIRSVVEELSPVVLDLNEPLL